MIAAAVAGLPAQDPPAQDPPAQDPQAQGPPAAATPPAVVDGQLVPLDRVVAKVGDDAILHSQILASIHSQIVSREADAGRPLWPQEQQQLFQAGRERLIDEFAMAQAVKTLGLLPPEHVEAILRQRVQEAEDEVVKQFGTQTAFGKELQRTGRTWDSWQRDTRRSEEFQLGRELTVYGRMQNQLNLFIRPKMLREFYERHREFYVYGSRCTFEAVKVDASRDPQRAMAVAQAAAELWRQQDIDGRQLAARSQQQQQPPVVDVVATGRTYRHEPGIEVDYKQFMLDFAGTAKAGEVSAPIRDGDGLWLIKVRERVDGRNSAFDEPEVQADIRLRLERQLLEHLYGEAVKRARDRTYVWRSS